MEFLNNNAPILIIVLCVLPFLVFVAFVAIGIILGEMLKNNPNQFLPKGFDRRNLDEDGKYRTDLPYPADVFGFFTTLGDGQVKIIETGDSFKDAVMNYPGHTFRGLAKDDSVNMGLKPSQEDYWDVVPTPSGEKDLHPIGQWSFWSWKSLFLTYRLAWWVAQLVVYRANGLVFVGLYPLRKFRVYRLEYFASTQSEEGKFAVERHVSYSDHLRVAPFQFFIPIGSAETLDLVAVKNMISQLMWCDNPYQAAYKADNNWGSFMFAKISSSATRAMNKLGIYDALTDNLTSNVFDGIWTEMEVLKRPDKAIGRIGFNYDREGFSIPDRSTADPDNEKALAAEALAKAKAKAEVAEAKGYRDGRTIRAEGDAEALAKVAEATKKAGPAGSQQAAIDGEVRVVQAAPPGAVVVVGGNKVDPLIAAIMSKT